MQIPELWRNFWANLRGREAGTATKLNVLSIVLLVLFDIFFVVQLQQGLDYQGSRARQPDTVVPWSCREIVRDLGDDPATSSALSEGELATVLRDYATGGSYVSNELNAPSPLPACSELFAAHDALRADPAVQTAVQNWQNLDSKISALQGQIDDFRREHRQFLEERAAGVTAPDEQISDLPADIRASYRRAQADLAAVTARLPATHAALAQLPAAQNLIELAQKFKAEVEAKAAEVDYWYPVYQLFLQALLILPLLALAVVCYRLSQQRDWLILRALTANAAGITGLFTFGLLLQTVYWLLPKRLLKAVYEFLASAGWLAIWNYLMILVGLLLFGGLILASQRGAEKWRQLREERRQRELVENLARVQKERVLRGVCQNCETAATLGQQFCAVCGENLLAPCSRCQQPFSPVLGFCPACGQAR